MNRAQLPSGIATGIGSLPHRDAAAAAKFSLTTLELPAIPTLPKRSPAEGMIPQALVGLEAAAGEELLDFAHGLQPIALPAAETEGTASFDGPVLHAHQRWG